MNLDKFNEVLLESVGVGLAILDPETLEVHFHNKRFGEWFSEVKERSCTLPELVPDLDVGRLRERMENERPHTADTEVAVKRRKISLGLHISRHDRDESSVLIVEAQNISKIKELEYMIESYSKMVEKQNRTVEREKERAEKLLLNIMPRKVYEEMKTFGVTTPQKYENASVLMLDFVDFTEMTVSHDPAALIAELNDIFTAFDQISDQFGCERIKTIGDAYMAVCGIPESTPDHAHNIARVALLFVHYLERRNMSRENQWCCRIGINTGPVIGSIVGVQKYVYDIFGAGVNLAARMEAMSGAMEITLCEDMHALIHADFHLDDRGQHEIKGFGTKRLFTLIGVDEQIGKLNQLGELRGVQS